MEIKPLIVLIITALLISSGLAIFADANASTSNVQADSLAMTPALSYNLTFVANGLTNLFNGSNGWYVDYFFTNNTGEIYALHPTSDTVSATVLAGTYYYQANDYFQNFYMNSPSPVITVNSNTTVYLNFSTPQTVTFHEQGLNSSYKWGVYMSGSTNVYTPANNVSGGSSILYYTIGGNFQYSWFESQNGINTTLGNSAIVVGNTNLSLSVPMSSFSSVTFDEKNLPSGTTWFMEQASGPDSNGSYAQSSTSTLTMRVMNGMNTFSAGYILNGFRINLSYETVSVGSVNNVQVDFPNLYQFNISASNLPASTDYNDWGFTGSFSYGPFHNTFNEANGSTPVISVLLPGTILKEVPFVNLNINAAGTLSGYTVLSNQLYNAISQPNQKQTIHFGTLYSVTLNFPGMPSADYLLVNSYHGNINSFEYYHNTPGVTLLAPNGTFTFTYGVGFTNAYYSALKVPFNFTVDGSSSTQNFRLYTVNFSNAYVSSGFSVSVENPHQNNGGFTTYFSGSAGSGQSVNTLLINGSYSYVVTSNSSGQSGLYINAFAQFNVSGADKTIVAQIPTTYHNVTMDATGLPVGTSFSMRFRIVSNTLGLQFFSTFGAGSNSYVYLPDGEYIANFNQAQYGGNYYYANNTYFNVSSATTVQLAFSVNAYLTVIEKGLPSGTTWSMVFNGTAYSTSRSAMVVSGNAGKTLEFSINSVGSYYPDPSSGNYYPASFPNYFNGGTVNKVLPVTFTPKLLAGQTIPVSTLNVSSMALGEGSQFNLSSTVNAETITPDSSNGLTYITYTTEYNVNGPGLLILNSSSYAVVARLSLGSGGTPSYSVLDQANGMLYIALSVYAGNAPAYYIASLNTASNNIQMTPVNIHTLLSLAIDQKTNMLYAAGLNAVYEINPATMSIAATIFMNNTYTHYSYGEGVDLKYSTQSGLLYATGYIPNGVVAINPLSNTISANYTFSIPTNPLYSYVGGSTLNQKGGILYYTLQQYYGSTGEFLSSLIAFNLQTGNFQTGPSLGQGYAVNIAYDSANGFVYIPLQLTDDNNNPLSSLGLSQLCIYDPSSGLLVNSSELASEPNIIAINPSNNNVMVSNYLSGSVTIVGSNSFGYITVTVSASTAVVSINGITVPVTGGHFAAAVVPGTYYISAFADGYAPVAQNVTVKEFATSNVSLDLNSTTATYEVSGKVSVASASVLFNGVSAAVNSTGSYQIYVSPGEYTVSAFKNGYFPLSEKVNITSNTVLDLTLMKEPSPSTQVSNDNVSAMGFNASISSVVLGNNGTVTLQFNATANGTLTVEIPFSDMSYTNITDILHSRVYINDVQYSNFSITISSNYTIILKVMGLNGDPTLIWAYNPSYVVPLPVVPPPNTPSGSQPLYIFGAIAAVIVVIGAIAIYGVKKKKRN